MISIFIRKRLFQPDTVRYITQLASGRPNFIHQKRIDELISGLKQDNNWALLDRLWIFAQPVQPLARVSLVNPTSTQITEVNAPTWTANQGYAGNAVNMYLNTNFNPNTQGVNYRAGNCSIGMYSRTNVLEAGNDMGFASATIFTQLISRDAGGFRSRINNTVAQGIAAVANADSTGLFSVVRTGAVNILLYRNAVLLATVAVAETSVPSFVIYIGSANVNDVATTFTTKQHSFAYAGSGAIDQLKLFLRMERYMDQLGTGVV